MDKSRFQFFVTCPDCKRKFGVSPEVVLKYLDRLLNEFEERIKQGMEKVKERAENKAIPEES